MDRPKHINTGFCWKCDEICRKYPGFHPGLRTWFFKLQEKNPDAHLSCAGRGQYLQELYYKQGSTRAHWGESAHNFNMAVDIFRMTLAGAEWGPTWFRNVVGIAVKAHNESAPSFKIKWYGDPDSKFFELPHCEVDGWKQDPNLKSVEPLYAAKKTPPPDSHSG